MRKIKKHWFLLLFWTTKPVVFSLTVAHPCCRSIWMVCVFCAMMRDILDSIFLTSKSMFDVECWMLKLQWFSGAMMFKFADSIVVLPSLWQMLEQEKMGINGVRKAVTVNRISTSLKPLLLRLLPFAITQLGPNKWRLIAHSLSSFATAFFVTAKKKKTHKTQVRLPEVVACSRQIGHKITAIFAISFLQRAPIHNRCARSIFHRSSYRKHHRKHRFLVSHSTPFKLKQRFHTLFTDTSDNFAQCHPNTLPLHRTVWGKSSYLNCHLASILPLSTRNRLYSTIYSSTSKNALPFLFGVQDKNQTGKTSARTHKHFE